MPLRDRYRNKPAEALVVLLLAIPALWPVSETTHRLRGLGVLLLLVAFALWNFRMTRKGARDPHRFVTGSQRHWLRDLRDLGRNRRV